MMTPQLIIGAYVVLILITSFSIYKLLEEQKRSKNSNKTTSLKKIFKKKKVVLDGYFDDQYKKEIVAQLEKWNVEIEHSMTEKTGILITGKNPDLMVIEDAKTIGAKIMNEENLLAQLHKPKQTTYIKMKPANHSKVNVQHLKSQKVS